MADPDISGMPDPSTIGLDPAKQSDPTEGMPTPQMLYAQHHMYDGPAYMNPSQADLDEFMAHPPEKPHKYTGKEVASGLTGLPRAAAGYALAIPAGVASIAGQGVGALGAALDPDHAGDYLEQGRDRGREWSAKVSNLANYVPATKQGGEFAEGAMSLPSNVVKDTAGELLKRSVSDNTYQAVSDVAQDIGADLPALGVPEAGRAAFKGGKAVVKAVTPTPKEAPTPPLTPPVGAPVTGDSLRASPNPIPAPDGTLHNEVHPAALPPATPKLKVRLKPTVTEAPTAPAEAPGAPPTEATAQEPTAQPPANAAPTLPESDHAPQDMSLSPEQRAIVREGVAARRASAESQRGSVRLFNSPAEEGPKETPAPEQQNERQGHLDAIDELSGGQLPSRRKSALTGDYNATGDDWQMKEVGNEQMRKQVASENSAMHAATENVHQSIGSEFDNSVDSTTLGDRGRVTRGAIQGIQGWFDKATDQMYDHARETNQGRQIGELQRVKSYLNDDSNFANDAEIGLQRAAKQRLERLWSTGDPDKGVPPGSVNAAEKFREFLNEKGGNPNAWGVAKAMKEHLDMDVAEKGGPGLFQTARALRTHSFKMLEEPTGIKKLLTPSDSAGINHQIPEHKVMDYIADLPREQHEHVLNVLRAGAHLGGGELAEHSAAAIREIQAHVVSRMHNAARNADGSWNARKFYGAADRYARNAPDTFKDRPDVLKNLKTINDAGNTLHMDKHYPGSAAQHERTGSLGHVLETGGKFASGLAHDIPVVGRLVGRAMENAVEGLGGRIAESTRDKAVAKTIVDRKGKQRGSVGVLPQRDAIEHTSRTDDEGTLHRYTVPDKGGSMNVTERPGLGVRQVQTSSVVDKGKGWGTRMLQRAADDAHANGQVLRSDAQVSHGQAGAYKNLAQLGYDVKMKPNDNIQGAYQAHGDHVFEVRPKGKPPGAQVNVGLHIGDPENGGRVNNPREVVKAINETGVKTSKGTVVQSHSEPTLVVDMHRPLTAAEGDRVAARTGQTAIAQRHADGSGTMLGRGARSAEAKAQGWDKYNPEYFRQHDGRTQVEHDAEAKSSKVPSSQRGSFSFQNDNEFNRSTTAARDRQRGAGIEPRNERNERVANQQMGGKKPLTAEQEDIIRRLGGASQRGSVRVMNEKPLKGAHDLAPHGRDVDAGRSTGDGVVLGEDRLRARRRERRPQHSRIS